MKRKDMLLIGVIAFFSAVISLVVSNMLFASPNNRQQQVEVVEKISPDFPPADQRYFNKDSIDPTQLIQIGNNNNQTPFNGTSTQ